MMQMTRRAHLALCGALALALACAETLPEPTCPDVFTPACERSYARWLERLESADNGWLRSRSYGIYLDDVRMFEEANSYDARAACMASHDEAALAAYLARMEEAHAAALSSRRPEEAQWLTEAQLRYSLRDEIDVLARFHAEDEALTRRREQLFERNGSYARLNESVCVASLAPFGPPEAPAELRSHFNRSATVHVRCLFPVTPASLTHWGHERTLSAIAAETTATGEDLQRFTFDVEAHLDQRHVDFEFELEPLVGQRPPGYVRVRTTLEWKEQNQHSRKPMKAESMALLSYE